GGREVERERGGGGGGGRGGGGSKRRMWIEGGAKKGVSKRPPPRGGPASRRAIGPPVALGSTACTARANWRNVSLSVGSPFGRISTLYRPSCVTHSRAISGGSVSSVTGCACR